MSKPRPSSWFPSLLLLAVLGACGDKSGSSAPGGGAETGSTASGADAATGETSSSGQGQESSSGTLRYRFEPPFSEATDVAVSEKRHYRVRLVAEGEGDVPNASLVSGCDCLSAEFATPLTAEGAEVDVYVEGHQVEDIEGVLWLEGPDRQQIAEHNVKILIQFKPYVWPREVDLSQGGRTFIVGVYEATPPGAAEKELIFEDALLDGAPFDLIDYQTPEDLTVDFLLRGHELTFEVPEDFQGPIDHLLILKMAEPDRSFEVRVRRKQ